MRHPEASSWMSVGWVLGAVVVPLIAQLFSGVLASTVATRTDHRCSRVIRVGREELSFVAGAICAATIMVVVALAGLDSRTDLSLGLGLGIATVARLSFVAGAHQPLWTRLLLADLGALICATIVALRHVL